MIRGVFNGHVPTISGYGPYVTLPEATAWMIAENHAGGTLARLEGAQTWFDVDWAISELPGQKDMFWLLKGETTDGRVRVFAIRNRDQSVQIATSGLDAFSVSQNHRGYLGSYDPQKPDSRLYWTNVNPGPGNVCGALSMDCTNPAFDDSLVSRASWSELVDIWYEKSQPGGNPPLLWQWPWTGLNKSPFTNRNRALTVVLGHQGADCSPYPTPCSTSTKFWFGPHDANDGLYGHEYGHRIVDELKSTDAANSQSGKLTEAMCDFFGMLSEDYRLQRLYPCSPTNCPGPIPRTDFYFDAPSSNQIADWTIPTSSCNPGMRATLGYSFYDAYVKTANFTVNITRDLAFNAWQIAILRAYEATPVYFPVASDLYAASVAQLPAQPWVTFPSPGPVVNLQQSLASTGCFP